MNSRYVYLICAALMISATFLFYPKWIKGNTERTITWDVAGYYHYLPSFFIYKDPIQQVFFDSIDQKYHPDPSFGQLYKHPPTGNFVMRYPMGQAFQFLPWFAAAHWSAPLLGYPADGYSIPYQAAIAWGSLLTGLFGLWICRRNLLFFFSDRVTAAVLLCLVFGTNYLEYSTVTGALTHSWLFTLCSALIYASIRFHQSPSFKWALWIGVCVGWSALTRPTEIIVGMIPVLWGIRRWDDVSQKIDFFRKNAGLVFVAAATTGLIGFLQLAYWKYVTGEWLIYTYGNQSFSWLRPHVEDVLISARAGWLVYTPLMIFGIAGLLMLKRFPVPQNSGSFAFGDGRPGSPAILLYLLLAFYITSAWDIWWYGGSLGQRAMVQAYPVWAFALAAFWQWVSEAKWRGPVLAILAGVFIYINLWWTYQAHRGGLFIPEQMTKRYMLKVLGRFEAERDWLKFLDVNEEFKGKTRNNVRTLLTENFNTDTTSATSADKALEGARSLILNAGKEFSPAYTIPVKSGEAAWLRASVTFQAEPKEWDWWAMTQFVVRFYDASDESKVLKERMIRLHRHVDGSEVKNVFFDVKVPSKPFGKAVVFFWHCNGKTLLRLDDLKVEAFD